MRTLVKLAGLALVIGSATAMAAGHITHDASSSSSMMNDRLVGSYDNTGLNARDKSGDTLTPENQPNSDSDIEVLAGVRSAIVDDKQLSTLAHNIKILVVKGEVTLRGPVKHANEKARIEELTRNVPGVMKIDNRLDVDTK